MNEKFFSLPEEKRQRIINGGFAVFSENSYQKSSMNEIAQQAQISKSLLFFYFRNKRELYLYLWKEACRLTLEYLNAYHCYEPTDLFEMMYRQMFLASEGYLWEMLQQGGPDRERMRRDFVQLLEFWKTTYLREDKR